MLHVDRARPAAPPRVRDAAAAHDRARASAGASARVAPRGWRLYFKGGWGSGSGAVDHQVALLHARARCASRVAIMTTGNGSHAAGKATLRGVAARLLRGLDRVTRPRVLARAAAARPASS